MRAEELRRQELTEALVGLVRTAGTGSFPRITDKDRVFFRGLAVSIQVVHDNVGDTLEPLALVSADTVEEVEDRVLLRCVILRRQVDGRLADGADEFGLVLDQLEGAAVYAGTLHVKSGGSLHIRIERDVDLGTLAETAHAAGLGVGRADGKCHGGNGQKSLFHDGYYWYFLQI